MHVGATTCKLCNLVIPYYKSIALIQGVANVGLQLFPWKIKINSVFYVLSTVNLLLPYPVFVVTTGIAHCKTEE